MADDVYTSMRQEVCDSLIGRRGKWSIYNAVSLGVSECAFIMRWYENVNRVYGEDDGDLHISAIVRWNQSSGYAITLAPYSLDMIVALDRTAPRLAAITQLGTAVIVDGDSVSQESVDDSAYGPDTYGHLTEARIIGDALYVVGMSGQLYRRSADGRWERASKGVINNDPRGSGDFVTVDGRSGSEIYTAGFGGEIWSPVHGFWRKLETPTNILINSLRVEAGGAIAACGQRGLLIRRERDAWRVLEQKFHQGDFAQLEFFGAAAFLATESGVFRVDPWPELDSATIVENSVRLKCELINAGYGALWMFGPRQAAVSADGQSWTELNLAPLRKLLP